MLGDEIVIDSPISSGKRARPTPSGNFHVLEKDKDHVQHLRRLSSTSSGRIVRRGVSSGSIRRRAERTSSGRR